MLFDTLVLTCLCRGTAYGESVKKIRIEPDANERVAFFEIDENSNKYSSFRRDPNVDGPICDLIILYTPTIRGIACYYVLPSPRSKRETCARPLDNVSSDQG